MHSLQRYIRKTIKRIAVGQDPDEVARLSPNIPSRHIIKIPERRSVVNSFSNTPMSSVEEGMSSSDESSYSMNSNGQGGSVIHLTSKPRAKRMGHLHDAET
jgi:hypothetical protein